MKSDTVDASTQLTNSEQKPRHRNTIYNEFIYTGNSSDNETTETNTDRRTQTETRGGGCVFAPLYTNGARVGHCYKTHIGDGVGGGSPHKTQDLIPPKGGGVGKLMSGTDPRLSLTGITESSCRESEKLSKSGDTRGRGPGP